MNKSYFLKEQCDSNKKFSEADIIKQKTSATVILIDFINDSCPKFKTMEDHWKQ
jgi:hypothetical protein